MSWSDWDETEDPYYCPECGTKMDSEDYMGPQELHCPNCGYETLAQNYGFADENDRLHYEFGNLLSRKDWLLEYLATENLSPTERAEVENELAEYGVFIEDDGDEF